MATRTESAGDHSFRLYWTAHAKARIRTRVGLRWYDAHHAVKESLASNSFAEVGDVCEVRFLGDVIAVVKCTGPATYVVVTCTGPDLGYGKSRKRF